MKLPPTYMNRLLFHSLAQDWGGRLEIERISEVVRAPFERSRAKMNAALIACEKIWPGFRSYRGRLFVDYVHDPTFDALATRVGDKILIGVCSGLVDTLLMCAQSLMADPRFLSNVGEPMGEEWPPTTEADFKRGFDVEARLKEERVGYFWYPGWKTPNDMDRRLAATLIAENAVEFAFLHELAHELCGHLDLRSADGGTSVIYEFRPTKLADIKDRGLQALELDADMTAAQLCIGLGTMFWHLSVDGEPGIEGVKPEPTGDRKTRELQTYFVADMWCAGVLLLFLILSQGVDEESAADSTHPRPDIRAQAIKVITRFIASKSELPYHHVLAERLEHNFREIPYAWGALSLPGAEMFPLGKFRDKENPSIEDIASLEEESLGRTQKLLEWARTAEDSPIHRLNRTAADELVSKGLSSLRSSGKLGSSLFF